MKTSIFPFMVLILFGTINLGAQVGSIESTMTDNRDGKVYQIVKIGDQWWMAGNLNFETSGGSWCYNNDPIICDEFGRLYDWKTATEVCPAGWHLPSDDEWKNLEKTFGIVKEHLDRMGWRDLQGNNIYNDFPGFQIIMAGYRPYGDGAFDDIRDDAYFWTSTSYDNIDAWKRTFDDNRNQIGRGYDSKRKGFSVRCAKD